MRHKERPVFLDLTKIKFPPMAIASILHRVSGVLLFVAVPLMLWALQLSLASSESFYILKQMLASPISKLITWALVTLLFYHLVAGVRHLIMDAGFGESLKAGRVGAYAVMALTVVFFVLAGFWIW